MSRRSKSKIEGFSEEEKQTWLDEKRDQERPKQSILGSGPVAVCVHCNNPFGVAEGVVTDEVALCDVCAGD